MIMTTVAALLAIKATSSSQPTVAASSLLPPTPVLPISAVPLGTGPTNSAFNVPTDGSSIMLEYVYQYQINAIIIILQVLVFLVIEDIV